MAHIMPMYAIRDRKAGFLAPTLDINDETAQRNFAFAVQTRDKMFMAFPDDYDLYKVGSYDVESGIIAPCDPAFVCSARTVLMKDVSQDV